MSLRDPGSEVDCCIVGAGPAGAVLGLLLARQGLRVVLLEACADFDREFRGDTLHPSAMEIMDELGLAERLLALPHSKIRRGVGETPEGSILFYDFARLETRFPYVTMLPQARFLEFVTAEAARYPGFELRMEAGVHELIRDAEGAVAGVRYRAGADVGEVRARLTVACDGRGSTVRRLAGLRPVRQSPPMDVLWFRLPRDGPAGENGFRSLIGPGHLLVLVDRKDYWQAGCVIRKGDFRQLRERGLASFRESLEVMAPEFRGGFGSLDDWRKIAVLSVESSRLSRWSKPGVLLIGDAAHAMSPIGGAGISLAIQDAVVAANRLAGPLARGTLEEAHLWDVERRRYPAVWIVQAFQSLVERFLVSAALDEGRPLRLPRILRLPIIREIPTRLIAFGPWRVHVTLSGEPA